MKRERESEEAVEGGERVWKVGRGKQARTLSSLFYNWIQ
jgi:hypothetical protein